MENFQYLPQTTPHHGSPPQEDLRSNPEHGFQTLTNEFLESEGSQVQLPSARCISPSAEVHEPAVLNNEAHVAQHERTPSLPRSGGHVGVEPQEHEGLLAGNTNIQRKPVATPESSLSIHECQSDTISGFAGPATGGSSDNPVAFKPIWRVWTLEVACILLSTLLFIIIVVVLIKFDEQVLPDWPLAITLNSFLALFTTMAKATFLIPVSIAISQTQWAFFNQEKSRPLYDLDVIDQASRGAWGSLVLLWRFRFQNIVVLGALLVAISSLTSPVTQLAINLYMQDVVVGGEEASTQVVRDLRLTRDKVGRAARQASFLATLLDYTTFRETLPYATVSNGGIACSTGNCTFDQYQSLGVCMKLANISSQLSRRKLDGPEIANITLLESRFEPNTAVWTASLPSGHEMFHQSKLAMFTDVINGNLTLGFQEDTTLQQARIASFISMYTTPIIDNSTWWKSLDETEFTFEEAMNHIDDFRHDATEVLFYLCVNTYETKVQMGLETTQVVRSSTIPLKKTGRPFVDLDCQVPLQDGSFSCTRRQARWNETLDLKDPRDKSLDSSTAGEGFSADYGALEELAQWMRSYMAGFVSLSMVPDSRNNTAYSQYGGEFVLNLHQGVFFGPHTMINPGLRQTCLQNIYQNFATGLTAVLRSGRPGMKQFVHGVFNVTGTASRNVPHVRITWPWVSLLAVEIAIAALFLALTIAKQAGGRGSRFRDVKSSSLATLVALNGDCRAAAGGGLGPVSELERIAKTLNVRLEGAQIVLADKAADEKSL